MKLGVLLVIYHSNNEIFFVVVLSNGKLDRSLFFMAELKVLSYSRHLGRNRQGKWLYKF